jgi:hypothetical protein
MGLNFHLEDLVTSEELWSLLEQVLLGLLNGILSLLDNDNKSEGPIQVERILMILIQREKIQVERILMVINLINLIRMLLIPIRMILSRIRILLQPKE